MPLALRRAGAAAAVLVIVASLAGGLLLLATPSAGAATALVEKAARNDGIVYPGPVPPGRFTEALIATEDHRFYSPFDPGVDPVAIARVILARIAGRSDQGGSTLEQQLAKMLYTPERHGVFSELEQIALAVKLDLAYSKAGILSMYAEIAYYGHGYYGLAAASCGYFGKAPADLTWAQAAMLAGVVNAPTADDPLIHPGRAHAREAHVLARLVAVGKLGKREARAALSRGLGLVRPDGSGRSACATGQPM